MSFNVSARATALCATLAIPVISWGQAQTHSADESVQRVVVTATRSELPVRQLAAEVTVITADALAASRGESLVDVISRLGGVQISRTGGPGQTSGSLIRGVAQKQSIVVVDGVRMVDATSGQVSLETLSADHIERIEILKGPASSIWGADAVGGVIQIITRQPQAPIEARARAALGGYGSGEAAANLGGQAPGSPLSWRLGVARESSRGVSVQTPEGMDFNPDRDGYRLGSAHLFLGWRFNDEHRLALRATASSLNSRYDGTEDFAYDPVTFALISADSSKDLRMRKANDQWNLTWSSRWRSDVHSEVRLGRSGLVSRSGIAETYDVRSTREQAALQVNWNLGDDVSTSWFVESAAEQGRLRGFYGDYAQRRGSHAVGLAVQGGRTRDLSWQVDARREVSDVYAGNTTGRAGGRWHLSDDLALSGVLGTTYRAPTFDDLYYPNFSNPNLRSERGHSRELGLHWRVGSALDVSGRIWRNRVSDLIEFDPVTFRPQNVSQAELEGVGLRARATALGASWEAHTDWTQAIDAGTRQRLARRAPQQHVLTARLPVRRVTYAADLKFLGKRADFGQVLPSETTLNLGATWRQDRTWTWQARVLNVTDERIRPAFGYQGLGRQIWLGAEVVPAWR